MTDCELETLLQRSHERAEEPKKETVFARTHALPAPRVRTKEFGVRDLFYLAGFGVLGMHAYAADKERAALSERYAALSNERVERIDSLATATAKFIINFYHHEEDFWPSSTRHFKQMRSLTNNYWPAELQTQRPEETP
jgi:hypothetical protein